MVKRIFAIAGIACGVLILVLGTMIFGSASALEAPQSAAFGADFYTYIYQGVRVVADSAGRLIALSARGLGALIIAVGLTDICYFGYRIAADVRRKDTGSPLEPSGEKASVSISEDASNLSDSLSEAVPSAPEKDAANPASHSTDSDTTAEDASAESGGSLGDTLENARGYGESYRAWRAPSEATSDAEEDGPKSES